MILQTFFTAARTAAVITTIVYFGTITLNVPEHAPYWQKVSMSLFPTACMTQTVKVMTGFELNDDGIDMDGLHRVYRSWSMKTGFTLYICSFIVMMLIGAWLELAVPRAEGRRHHCCFCFMPSFWKCKRDNFKVYT